MKPLDLMEAIGNMDDEFIRLCLDEDPAAENKAVCNDPSQTEETVVPEIQQFPNKKSSGSAVLSYLLTAGCTAACICGMAFLIRFTNADKDFSVQTSTLDSAITEIMPLATTAVSGTTFVSDPTAETGTGKISAETSQKQTGTTVTSAVTAQSTAQTAVQQQTANRSDSRTTAAAVTQTTTATTRINTTTRTNTTAQTNTTVRTTGTERSAATVTTTAATTTTVTAATTETPEILRRYCQTMSDGQPLWAAYRSLTYHDGLEYCFRNVENGEYVYTPNTTPFGRTGMFIEIGCAQGAPGDTVTVPVYISGVPDLLGLSIFIDPPEGLEPVSITSNLDLDFELPFAAEHETSPYASYLPKGSFVFTDIAAIHPSDGYAFVYYSYKIPEDAQPGTVYPVRINPAKTEFRGDYEEEPVYDLNHDGEIDDEEYEAQLLGLDTNDSNYQYTQYNGVIVVE